MSEEIKSIKDIVYDWFISNKDIDTLIKELECRDLLIKRKSSEDVVKMVGLLCEAMEEGI